MIDPTRIDVLVVKRVIHAPANLIYRVWTEPDLARKWSWGERFDTVDVTIDCRVGGRWAQTVRDRASGEIWSFDGEFLRVEVNRRLRFTFFWHKNGVPNQATTTVDVEFCDLGDDTELTIRHYDIANDNDRRGTQHGWTEILGIIGSIAETNGD